MCGWRVGEWAEPAGCGAALVQRGNGERRCDVRHHDIPRDVPRPIGKALNVERGNGVLVRDPKLARLLLVYVFCQLKVVVR